MLSEVQKELKKFADKEKAKILKRFFKTGPGEYGEGDVFIGVKVSEIRKTAKKFAGLGHRDTAGLLRSSVHEERMTALLIFILKYKAGDLAEKERIYKTYLKNTSRINNWDLVDVTAEHIIGEWLRKKKKTPLYSLARSQNLWERRISIIATFCFIKNREFKETLKIAKILINDKEDLIHKAVGWMLREVGKRDLRVEEDFLSTAYKTLPRTMLRYAIEKFPEKKRLAYLRGEV